MLLFSELKKRNLLSNESMSNVRGGDSGSCGYETASGKKCGVSKETALAAVSNGGHWCCDSCATSTYCREDRIDEEADYFWWLYQPRHYPNPPL